jgi:hypothetical protein
LFGFIGNNSNSIFISGEDFFDIDLTNTKDLDASSSIPLN